MVDQAEPLRLIVTGFGYNGLVTISSFSNTQTAGREEDRDIEITLFTSLIIILYILAIKKDPKRVFPEKSIYYNIVIFSA
ncbi:putative peptidoglycan-binding LysM domain protein [Clostridioides difficile CD160]|nr:putative peptidoglycan-binding LysM domain protein [Clostridioides difficile CD160]